MLRGHEPDSWTNRLFPPAGAFYRMSLDACSDDFDLCFGTMITHRHVSIGHRVYVGGRCTIGQAIIEDDVMIGSNVDLLSGRRQHHFDDVHRPIQDQGGILEQIRIGHNSWIGNSAVVMANIGNNCVIGPGERRRQADPAGQRGGREPGRREEENPEPPTSIPEPLLFMIYMILGYMWLFIHRPFEIWPVLGTIRLEFIYVLATIVVWLLTGNKRMIANPLQFAYGAFTLAVLLSWLASPWSSYAKVELNVGNYLKLMVFYVILVTSVRTERELKIVVLGLLGAMGLFMLHSYREFLAGAQCTAWALPGWSGSGAA